MSDFHFEIRSLAAFAAFIALIRSTDIDDATLAKLTAQLVQTTTALSEAEKADAANR
jgi:hypothetical protein